MAVRTWAPCGQTPVLHVPLTRDHLAAISGITQDGRLFMQVRPASYDAAAVVGFLRVLLRKLSGKIVVVWDGSPIHRRHEVKDFLKRGAAKRLYLEQLPGYAPDLNPDEGIWNYLKRVELGNVCCLNLDHLSQELLRGRRALAIQKGDHSKLFAAMWLLALVLCHEISKTLSGARNMTFNGSKMVASIHEP